MNKKIIAFNWKMNPQSLGEAKKLFRAYLFSKKEIVICPPFIYLNELKNLKTKNLKLGAQNIFWEDSGAFTGEISPKMLKNLGVEYVIIGHSERRQILGETDEIINKKVLVAISTGLKVILCVGEPLKIREQGEKAVKNFIKSQLEKDLKNIKNLKLKIKNLIVAYEPIWAIGAGNYCEPKNAAEIIKFIKKIQNSRVLYGGSVDSRNIKNFLRYKEIDGFLIGNASLKPKEIENIIKIINIK